MKNPIGIVVPSNINAAKKFAKKLNTFFPSQKLSKCQAVTAQLYGHQDWFNLENAIKQGMKSGPFNEDMDNQDFQDRIDEQMRILARELSDADMEEDYLIREVFKDIDEEASLELAGKRYVQILAETIIADMSPTYGRSWQYPQVPLGGLGVLEGLPTALGKWWQKHVPSQPEVGQALSAFELDVNDRLDLIRFGYYWGMLCRHYKDVVPEALKMGIAYMLADRFSSLSLAIDPDYAEANEDFQLGEIDKDDLEEVAQEIKADELLHYLKAYPIHRYATLSVIMPEDLLKNVPKAIKILKD
jgi:hypothetical protein